MYVHFSGILVCFRDVEPEGKMDSVNYTVFNKLKTQSNTTTVS